MSLNMERASSRRSERIGSSTVSIKVGAWLVGGWLVVGGQLVLGWWLVHLIVGRKCDLVNLTP